MTKQRPLSVAGQAPLSELCLQRSPQCLDSAGHCTEGGRHWKSRPALWTQQVPVSMPWSQFDTGAVTFTGSVTPAHRKIDFPGVIKIKRRCEVEGDGPSRKHFLSEDAMTARFTCLSLSNDHIYTSNGFPVAKAEDSAAHQPSSQDGGASPLPDMEEEEDCRKDVIVEGMFDMRDSRLLVMSPELQQRLHCPPEDILPREVLQSMSEQCMELILWQSPGNLIQRAIQSLRHSAEGTQAQGGGAEHTDTSQTAERMEL